VGGLPDSGRYDILAVMSLERIGPKKDILRGSIGSQENDSEGVSAIEMPDLIQGESVEERVTQGLLAVEADHGRSSGSAWLEFQGAPIRLDEKGAFDGQWFQSVAADQFLDGGIHDGESVRLAEATGSIVQRGNHSIDEFLCAKTAADALGHLRTAGI
jgi:hypothetical protein